MIFSVRKHTKVTVGDKFLCLWKLSMNLKIKDWKPITSSSKPENPYCNFDSTTYSVILGNCLCNLYVNLNFLICKTRDSTCLIGLLWAINELMYVNCIAYVLETYRWEINIYYFYINIVVIKFIITYSTNFAGEKIFRGSRKDEIFIIT